MTQVVVVYHSGYGHTQRMAQAVADGAGAQLVAIDAEGNLPAGGWEQLKAADAIIFGSPTYMGGVSWQFKKFADASSRPWYAQEWKDKLAAGFTNSAGMNGDKQGTLTSLFTLAMQHSMLWVSQGLMPSNTKMARATTSTTWCPSGASPVALDAARRMSPGDLEPRGCRPARAISRGASGLTEAQAGESHNVLTYAKDSAAASWCGACCRPDRRSVGRSSSRISAGTEPGSNQTCGRIRTSPGYVTYLFEAR